jgi:hypothetical protein
MPPVAPVAMPPVAPVAMPPVAPVAMPPVAPVAMPTREASRPAGPWESADRFAPDTADTADTVDTADTADTVDTAGLGKLRHAARAGPRQEFEAARAGP